MGPKRQYRPYRPARTPLRLAGRLKRLANEGCDVSMGSETRRVVFGGETKQLLLDAAAALLKLRDENWQWERQSMRVFPSVDK